MANQKRVGGASPLEGYSCVENGECGEQRGDTNNSQMEERRRRTM
jgi:hypothetical protein